MTAGHVELDGRPVLRGIDLRIDAGEMVVVLGANGSGKSTLIRALLGLTPMSSGSAELHGVPPARFRDWHRIGYVPQRLSVGGGVPATVREVVASGRVARRGRLRRTSAADRAAVARALDAVGLAGRAGEPVGWLSGGQQQRVLIARALAGEPDTFVMDEPTAGVDAESQGLLAASLATLVKQGRTVLLVAHELGPLEPLVTRSVLLSGGRVVHDGLPGAGGSGRPSADGHAPHDVPPSGDGARGEQTDGSGCHPHPGREQARPHAYDVSGGPLNPGAGQ
ncbi:metal ABC transporter ATP-binding protein [Sphaerisporangium sp. TRM90804]|uniref:metal ABC transporter ATP-binding protein n=1 Tax=Sphaerisporangium sp. TRM90804 TaxID=3031113 RepID=UPI0024477AC7|nr:metal ABC transporter ATP-binding protein [Sphaerisporangium sp. TRM90804]MDH2425021.1 metal ABC transporter ATP-binding protein [Sphaerisporangium sp. TRM90804]